MDTFHARKDGGERALVLREAAKDLGGEAFEELGFVHGDRSGDGVGLGIGGTVIHERFRPALERQGFNRCETFLALSGSGRGRQGLLSQGRYGIREELSRLTLCRFASRNVSLSNLAEGITFLQWVPRIVRTGCPFLSQ